MNISHHLTVEEASRLAVTATAADLEDWAHSAAVHGRVDLDDLLHALDVLRADSLPAQTEPHFPLSTPADNHPAANPPRADHQARPNLTTLPPKDKQMNDHTTTITLAELHDEYVERVNLAVSEGRDDLIEALSAEFTAKASTAHANPTDPCPH